MNSVSWKIKADINQLVAFAIIVTLSFAVFYNYIFYNPHFFYSEGDDASYYISIANNLYAGLGFYDATSIPKVPVITPQNGIVIVELLLMKSGINESATLFATVAMVNYLLMLFSAVLLYKIANHLAVPKLVNVFIIANFLLSINIFIAIIHPTNDGIAFALSILGLFLCIQNHEKDTFWLYLLILVVTAIGVHFRLQNLMIPFCASIASLMLKQKKGFYIYLLITILSFLFIYIPYQYLFKDASAIDNTIQITLSRLQADGLEMGIRKVMYGLAVLFLKFGEGSGSIYAVKLIPVFLIITALTIYSYLKIVFRREYASMLLVMLIFSSMTLFLISPAPSYRYIILVSPLAMIILGSAYKWKHLCLPFFAAYLLYGVAIFIYKVENIEPYYMEQKRQTELILPLLKNDTMLLSELPRISYMLFNKSSSSEAPLHSGNNEVLIFGSTEYVLRWVNQIKSESPHVRVIRFGTHWNVLGTQRELVKVTLVPQ